MTSFTDARQLPASVASDVQKLEPGTLLVLFTLDATALGGSIYNFHSGTNELSLPIVFDGVTYSMWPIEASGFELTSKGTLPTPSMRVANITGLIGSLCNDLEDLVGSKLIRRKVFAKYIDAVNFPGSINPSADPSAKFPDEVWFVDRKTSENRIFVEFSLASAMDVEGVQLPRRQVIANSCTWKYRSSECGYTGTNYFDLTDTPTTSGNDACSKRLSACKLRFGTYAELPFGGFPGAGRVR